MEFVSGFANPPRLEALNRAARTPALLLGAGQDDLDPGQMRGQSAPKRRCTPHGISISYRAAPAVTCRRPRELYLKQGQRSRLTRFTANLSSIRPALTQPKMQGRNANPFLPVMRTHYIGRAQQHPSAGACPSDDDLQSPHRGMGQAAERRACRQRHPRPAPAPCRNHPHPWSQLSAQGKRRGTDHPCGQKPQPGKNSSFAGVISTGETTFSPPPSSRGNSKATALHTPPRKPPLPIPFQTRLTNQKGGWF